MILTDKTSVTGKYYFINNTTGETLVKKNVVVQGFFTAVLQNLHGESTGFAVTKIAAGTGTAPAMITDTALGNQTNEKTITSSLITLSRYQCKTILGPSEFVGSFTEFGIFAGSLLISRVNVDFVKNNSSQYTVIYQLDIK